MSGTDTGTGAGTGAEFSNYSYKTMRRSRKPVTIYDVAEAAGVSVSTVSRVLNDKDDVAAETYERVQQVIAELGYASSLAARGMRDAIEKGRALAAR